MCGRLLFEFLKHCASCKNHPKCIQCQLTSISLKSLLMCLFFMLMFDINSCCRSMSDNWSGESSSLPCSSRPCIIAISSESSLILALYCTRSLSNFAIDFFCFSICSKVDFRSMSDDTARTISSLIKSCSRRVYSPNISISSRCFSTCSPLCLSTVKHRLRAKKTF